MYFTYTYKRPAACRRQKYRIQRTGRLDNRYNSNGAVIKQINTSFLSSRRIADKIITTVLRPSIFTALLVSIRSDVHHDDTTRYPRMSDWPRKGFICGGWRDSDKHSKKTAFSFGNFRSASSARYEYPVAKNKSRTIVKPCVLLRFSWKCQFLLSEKWKAWLVGFQLLRMWHLLVLRQNWNFVIECCTS